jgi:RNA polymerase sigma-70 factor (ECF subfamily)
MDQEDYILIRRFVRQGDGEAFAFLMDRYADMVYSTCLRILRDESQTSDAVQETFFQFSRNAERITGSLGSWLHRVATRRAVDLVRQNVARRRREESYALEADTRGDTWNGIEPLVDEALEGLPDEARDLLVRHFLEGQSTVQLAAALHVSQPTISRRIARALEELRQGLRRHGVLAGVVPLQTILIHTRKLAPETLRRGLGKIALAKAASASAPTAVVGAKLAMAGAALVVATGITWFAANRPAPTPSPPAAPATAPPPAPVETAAFAEPGPVALNLLVMATLNQSAQAGSAVAAAQTTPVVVRPTASPIPPAEPATTNRQPAKPAGTGEAAPGREPTLLASPLPQPAWAPPSAPADLPSGPDAGIPYYPSYLSFDGFDSHFLLPRWPENLRHQRVIEEGLNRPYNSLTRAVPAQPAGRARPGNGLLRGRGGGGNP